MFVTADVDLGDLASGRVRWWLRSPYVRLWHRIMAMEKIRNYRDAVERSAALREKYPAERVIGLLYYLRWRETGSISVAARDVARLLRARTRVTPVIPARGVARKLRPELRKWRILLIKSTGYELHEITKDLKRRGFPAYELRKVLPG